MVMEELAELGEMKIGRQHAYDLVRAAVELDFAADGGGIGGEAAVPEFVGNHYHSIAAGPVFLIEQQAAGLRPDPQHGEKIGRHARGGDAFRLARAGKVHRHPVDDRHLREGVETFPPFQEMHAVDRKQRGEMSKLGHDFMNYVQPPGLAVSERPENGGIHQAEHSGGRADGERQSGNGDRAESRRLAQRARGQTEIVPHID
jgi:hypothetical protein